MTSPQSNMDLKHLMELVSEQKSMVDMLKKEKDTPKKVLYDAIAELKHRKNVYMNNMNNMNNSPLPRYTTYGPHSTNICSRSCVHLVRTTPLSSCQCTRNNKSK